ncbi:hypothetical protein Tco_1195154 [Tanacetum coccineum]
MSSMSEDIQCAGSDTRPPMLDRTDFESWQQRIHLYCLGKDNGENIMKSITEGPFQMGTMRDTLTEGGEGALHLGPERARVFADLSAEQKDMYKADIRATNILLQGIPKDIYTLINHFTDAKDIWDNVKMILEGSELTKDDRESQLYDEFEHFCQIKGETIHVYYVRFLQPTNDPLALVSNASVQQYSTQSSKSPQSSNEPSPADNFQLDSGSSSTENLIESLSNSLALLTQSYKSHLPQTNNQLRTSSNARNKATVQDGRVVVQDVRGQNRGGIINPGQAKPIKCYNCNDRAHSTECQGLRDFGFQTTQDKMLLTQEPRENGAVLDENSLYIEMHKRCTTHNGVKSDADYTSDNNIIPYDQYVEDNEEHVVQSNVSSVRNDALMLILDEMHEHD